jgi:hypothetical protein
VLAATALLLFGAGCIALGLVEQEMYDVGIVVVLVALVGLGVRFVDWMRWLTRE